jgi:NhaA family Na+:H+ antiporter
LGINDGLMVLFFLLVGMEIKREFLQGELSQRSQVLLPVCAAAGGMLFPAFIYLGFNPAGAAMHGWAIPSATDIAFSLCVINLCGSRVPSSLKVFLTPIAVIDDLGAVLIIALFYAGQISAPWLLCSVAIVGLLCWLNAKNTAPLCVYIVLGILLWIAVLQSGVHATVAGVLLGVLIPMEQRADNPKPMLMWLEEKLHPWVSYGVLPLFAFANAGVHVSNLSLAQLSDAVSLGTMLGLFAGKQVGIFLSTALLVGMKIASKPAEVSWGQLYAVSVIAGIGFTMSLFIDGLAFVPSSTIFEHAKLGVIIGSVMSAIAGFAFLRMTLPATAADPRQS